MQRVLLIVDDHLDLAKCLRRSLKRDFEKVYVATCPEEAETFLDDNIAPPTHILCDYYFAPDIPLGTELIQKWRERHTNIVQAAVITGAEIQTVDMPKGVDAVFRKPVSSNILRNFLGDHPSTNKPSK